jgi:hypothetical protein
MDFSGSPPIYPDAMSDTGNLDRMIVERQSERVWANAMIWIGYARDSIVGAGTPALCGARCGARPDFELVRAQAHAVNAKIPVTLEDLEVSTPRRAILSS